MAWNEPGGNSNNQDPWGGRKGGGRQGPPDLDEAFRKLQESLNGLFGGGKKRGDDSGRSGGGGFGLLFVGLGLLGWYGCTARSTWWMSRSRLWCCASASTTRPLVLA